MAFYAPSTLSFLRNYKPTIDFNEIEKSLPTQSVVSFTSPKTWYLVVVGFLLYTGIKIINSASETEFLYFQFQIE